MRIVLVGATGLVGSKLLPLIRNHDLLVLTRRPTGTGVAERIAAAVEWPRLLSGTSIDAAVSTLGATWKMAGSWAEFERVDRTAVVEFARAARDGGASQLVSVSSVGADPDSNNRYLALTGRTEADLAGSALLVWICSGPDCSAANGEATAASSNDLGSQSAR